MKAKEFDKLQIGDRVLTFNGGYTQNGVVTRKEVDLKGMRWVGFRWIAPNKQIRFGIKRYVSVHLSH